MDSPDSVVDFLNNLLITLLSVMIQETFILSSLISLSSPSGMNTLELTVATKSAVCFSEKENQQTF